MQILITDNTPLSLASYAEPAVANTADSNAGFGWTMSVALSPVYEEIFIYKISGEAFAAADQFTLGGTTYSIQASGVTVGKWGFVHDFDATNNLVKISLDGASAAFVAGDIIYDTPTLLDANRTASEIVSGKGKTLDTIGAANASRTEGTYNGLLPTGGNGTGLKVNVSVAASTGAATVTLVNGGKNYQAADTVTITDANLGGGGAPNLTFNVASIGTGNAVGATATTFINAEDYIAYDDALAANTAERITGLVVGPGQNIIVYSSAGDISYNVTGFESASEDYVQVLNTKSAQ